MSKYYKGENEIEATEKAFNVIYKPQGYITQEEHEKSVREAEKQAEIKSISKMNKEELQKLALKLSVGTEEEIGGMNVEQLKLAIKAKKEEI